MGVVTTLRQAVASIPDGTCLTLGGFQLNRAPMALVFELIRQTRRDLRVVSVPNPLPLDLLVAADAVAEAEFGFLGFQYEEGFVVAPNVRGAIESGRLRFRERDVYEIVQALRAGAQGVPFLPAPGGEGSDYARVNRTPIVQDPATGAAVPIATALRPEVALLHAQVADRRGNLRIDDPYAESLLARASRRVIASAEKLVERLDDPTIPSHRVEAVVEAPAGAFPTGCHRGYPYSATHLREYLAAASAGRSGDYLRRYVTGTADHAAFVRAIERPGGGEPAAAPGRGAPGTGPAAADRLVVEMSRCIADGDVVATGVASALPMLAVALARATHAPGLTYINCVGAVDPVVSAASPTSVDPRLLERCEGTVSLPDLFDRARRGGIDLMFFGAAQVDPGGRTNSTCIGDYHRPRVKLPGPAGASSMRPYLKKVVIAVPRHSPRSLVERVDFCTTAPSPRNAVTTVLTDRARFRLDGGRLRLVSRAAGVTAEEVRSATAFALEDTGETDAGPTRAEADALRRLDPDGIRHRMI